MKIIYMGDMVLVRYCTTGGMIHGRYDTWEIWYMGDKVQGIYGTSEIWCIGDMVHGRYGALDMGDMVHEK